MSDTLIPIHVVGEGEYSEGYTPLKAFINFAEAKTYAADLAEKRCFRQTDETNWDTRHRDGCDYIDIRPLTLVVTTQP
jgi:hypothetical protein